MASMLSQRSVMASSSRLVAPRGVRSGAASRSPRLRVQAAANAMVCIDCGYIYDGKVPFDSLPGSYKCPVCDSPKKRFKALTGKVARGTDAKAMNARRDALRKQVADSGEEVEGDNGILYATAASAILFLGAFYVLAANR
ncbi:hypothetical protein FOA52_009991 [Chlamydomonas sp. UWO 241]|nr:hypothetical protein FOA52_009991 [Chlamydomonas sp. UWO 241]